MAQSFSFDNAAFHFARTDGLGRFLIPFLGTYLVVGVVVTAINFGIQVLLFGSMNGYAELLQTGSVETIQFGLIMVYFLVIAVLGGGSWAIFEASIQRRYVRDEGFSIRLGGDELRLLVVGLLWFLTFFGSYMLMILLTMIPVMMVNANGVSPIAPLIIFVFVFAYLCAWTWAAVRLSAASALTIRDRKIRFLHAWGATRGRFWALFGAYLLLFIIIFVAYILFIAILLGASLGGGFSVTDTEIFVRLGNPQAMGAMYFVTFFVMTIVQSLFLYVWAGPAALAAKTDPRSGGRANVVEEFA